MSEDSKKPSEDEKKTSDKLSEEDLEQVTGGQGGQAINNTDDKHKDWIEI